MEAKRLAARLEYLRQEIRAERISYDEIHELQSLVKHIDPSDVELLEWAGVEESEQATSAVHRKKEFKKGDRVRLSEEGSRRLGHSHDPLRLGTVPYRPHPNKTTICVRWDGQKTHNYYTRMFIAKVQP